MIRACSVMVTCVLGARAGARAGKLHAGFEADAVMVGRVAFHRRQQLGGKTIRTNLKGKRPVHGGHEAHRNERANAQGQQHEADQPTGGIRAQEPTLHGESGLGFRASVAPGRAALNGVRISRLRKRRATQRVLAAARPACARHGTDYGATHPMMGTVLMEFFGLPSITRSL